MRAWRARSIAGGSCRWPALAGGRWVGGGDSAWAARGARSSLAPPPRSGWLAAGKRAVGWSRASRGKWVRGQAAGDGGGDGDGGRKRKGMALFRRLFYRKPPDRLLEIADRVYGTLTRPRLLF